MVSLQRPQLKFQTFCIRNFVEVHIWETKLKVLQHFFQLFKIILLLSVFMMSIADFVTRPLNILVKKKKTILKRIASKKGILLEIMLQKYIIMLKFCRYQYSWVQNTQTW